MFWVPGPHPTYPTRQVEGKRALPYPTLFASHFFIENPNLPRTKSTTPSHNLNEQANPAKDPYIPRNTH